MTTKAIQRLDDRMAEVPPGTLRHEALETAKQFKRSWIDLGRVLWSVWKERAFRDWGFLTFDAYCAKELGIKAMTAKKLLHSYGFLEREEPVVLKRLVDHPPSSLPHYEAVNALRLFKQRPAVPERQYEAVRSQVLEEGREPQAVRKEIRAALAQQADPDEVRTARRQTTIRRMIGTLKFLRLEMEVGHLVPAALLAEIERVTKKLEQVL